MAERKIWLDPGIGERRGVVTLDGRPERLLIERDGDQAVQAAGARSTARVRKIERASAIAFVEMAAGPDAALNLDPDGPRLVEGQLVEIEIRIEARHGKGPVARLVGEADGSPSLVAAGPTLEERLASFGSGARLETGGAARAVADAAQVEALATQFALPGGGAIVVEPTRALTAVDVDLGSRSAANAKQAARAANFAALAVAARVLRLKGLGGLVVIDFVGRGHDAPALLSAARAAFAPDNPGVAFAHISRFGVLEMTIPRRYAPSREILADQGGAPRPLTVALELIRRLEREASLDGGGRFVGQAAPEVAVAAVPALALLAAKVGNRVMIEADPSRPGASFEVIRS